MSLDYLLLLSQYKDLYSLENYNYCKDSHLDLNAHEVEHMFHLNDNSL